MRSHKCLWVSAMMAVSLPVQAEQPAARIVGAARQAWAITDLVLQKDIDPSTRQEMLLNGIKALPHPENQKTSTNLAARISEVTTLEQFTALLADVWPADAGSLQKNGESPEQVLFNGLLSRRMSDEQRAYLSPFDLKRHEMIAGNRYVGTGIQIRVNEKEKLTQIMIPFPGGPARKAGARPGDLIVEVDGKSMEGESIAKVVAALQGEEGTKVSMTVRQPDESKTRLLPMIRSVIPFTSVQGYRRAGEESWEFFVDPKTAIGYLSFEDISISTPLELRKIEPLLRAKGARALVMDLRFARGADMRHAALTADSLLDGGLLWKVRDCQGKVKEYKADRDCLFRDLPMAVLIGEHTGSMAALVAAALQDRGRAVLVGESPKAELHVISLVPLADEGGAILLRTGRVVRSERAASTERPRSLDGQDRLVPDHRVPMERKETESVLAWMQQQKYPDTKNDAKTPSDPQLDKAIELMRAALTQQK